MVVCNWLVYDHLSRQDYQYSLSTFVTEAQLPYPEKFLTAGDVLGLLGLKNAADFENISKLYSLKNELGLLHSLLLAIIKTMFNVSNKDLPLDTSYLSTEDINSQKILQNDKNESTQSFVQDKSEAVADTSFHDLSQLHQMSLDKNFLTNDSMRSTEISFHKELQSFKEENEKEVQKMRRRLLDELDSLYSQKRKMQLELEHTRSELKREQNKVVKEKEMLKEKEVLLEKELTNQFEMKVRSLESEFAEKLYFKDKEVESLKKKISEKDDKMTYLEVELASEKESINLTKQELNDLKNRNKILQDKYSSVLDENTNLLRKFEHMSDYSLVKEELSIKSREVTRLQNEIKDLYQKSEAEKRKYAETVRNLENDLNIKEPQLVQAREEIDDVRNTLKKEQAVWNKERRKVEHELRELKERYDVMIQELEEKNQEIEDLHQTIHLLNYKLTNNVINAAKSESVGLFKSYQRPVSNQKNYQGILFNKRNTLFQQQSEKDYDSKFKFFLDKKSTYGALKQEENKVQEKYSVIFGTIPEYNKQMSYSRNYNFSSLPKKNIDSYNVFSKPLSTTSFNYNKSKLSAVSRNPYSLNDVRQMVTHSLLPYKTSKQVNFQPNISNFRTSSQVPSSSDTRMKDNWKVPESNNPYSFHKHYSMTEANGNTSTLNTETHKSSLSRDNSTFEHSLHFTSQDKNEGENHKTELNLKESNKEITTGSDNTDKLQESSGSLGKNSLKENSNEHSPDINKNVATTVSENSVAISEQKTVTNPNFAVTVQSQAVLDGSNQHLHSATSKLIEKESKSNFSVDVNLDDAWKKRSSVTSLSYMEGDVANSKSGQNYSLFPSSLAFNNTTFNTKQHALDNNIKKTDKMGLENAFNRTTENIDTNPTMGSTEDISHLQENRNNQTDSNLNIEKELSLYDKTNRSTDIDTVDVFNEFSSSKETKSNTNADRELSLKETKQVSNSSAKRNEEEEKTKKSEEEDNLKSSDKTGTLDTSSEQSELHLSCGSEAEQQKEDSDAW